MMGDITEQQVPDSLTQREIEILQCISNGMSDQEIAQDLFISVNTVKWHNRQIYSKLGVGNRRQAVDRARVLGLLNPIEELLTRLHNLPAPVTSFIGRAAEVLQVAEIIQQPDCRLICLTGPPGTGKTRLALEVARAIMHRFEDGIYMVPLAPLQDSDLVIRAIADVLQIREVGENPLIEMLKAYLLNKQILLLLDNFEHVVQAASQISQLLIAAPDLKILVTSRERLRLSGEHEFRVPPLRLPDGAQYNTPDALAEVEAVALFIERVQTTHLDFALNEYTAPLVADICIQLDGLPLAIELAAARAGLFTLRELQARLANRLGTLRVGMQDHPKRHQTLRAAVAWSYQLLGTEERVLFNRMGVFRGGCTLEAVEQICGFGLSIPVLDALEGLVNKSILKQERWESGQVRFTYLEMLREYALEHLEECGEEQEIRRRHVDYFLALAEQAEQKLKTSAQSEWLKKLELEHENMLAALHWLIDISETELGLRLIGALGYFWLLKGYITEAVSWTEQAIELASDAPSSARAKILGNATRFAMWSGNFDHPHLRTWFEEAEAIYSDSGEKSHRAWILGLKAFYFMGKKETEVSESLIAEAMSLVREINDRDGLAWMLLFQGELARLRQDNTQAQLFHEESLTIYRELDNRFFVAMELMNLGFIYQRLKDIQRMEETFREGLILCDREKFKHMTAHMICGLASVSAAQGQYERAARLFGAGEAHLEAQGIKTHPTDAPDVELNIAASRSQLDESVFETAWEEGRNMKEWQSIAYALKQVQE